MYTVTSDTASLFVLLMSAPDKYAPGSGIPSDCQQERVYSTLIVYGQDQIASGSPLEPLDLADNTLEFINTMTFPVSLIQKDPDERAKCKNIKNSAP